jgi:hypothetical protein
MIKNNKLFSLLHLSVILFTGYVCYLRFFRYLLADDEAIAVAMLNPEQLPTAQPGLFSLIMLVILILFFGLLRLKPSASLVFRLVKGGYGYCLVLLLLLFTIMIAKDHFPEQWNSIVYESKHLFVEVQANETRLRSEPSLESNIITTVDAGTLLLLNDVKQVEELTWNRVLLAPSEYAWIVRVVRLDDSNRKRLSKTSKFYFTLADQMSLLIALIGLVWGLVSYKN